MKAIIIGAGIGNRIGEIAKKTPKALIEINGITIAERQISLFKKNGISDIVIITGPYNDKFDLKNIIYVYDSNYSEHDILGSLMEAKSYIKDDVLIIYSDILFDEKILSKVLRLKCDIGIAVDLNWEDAYNGRLNHPKSEAENVLLDNNGKIIQIKKNIQSLDVVGEFLGLMKLSPHGSEVFVKKYESLQKNQKGEFHDAPSLSKAYLTDMIQELINSQINVM
ncbi:MAG: NTP transferase domain-containing protein, partial [Thaumarchaeota archaeon]|nr:NTP transferase domain-containing protein [Nitrososphaerota archaeon]